MAAPNPFSTANPHALACILEAAETRSIISATDIFDTQGIKLWAANQPVTAELQRKLADRRLREPLETSLIVQDGINIPMLVDQLQAIADGDGPLATIVQPQAKRLLRELAGMSLQPAVQLLLTASQATRPAQFAHAVAGMALNGALMAASGGDTPEIRTALLAGLLHDLGEMYIAPRFGEADAEREMDFVSYQQLVVHPHVGYLLIKQLTHYATSVAQAVAEHHERLDGTGYPHARRLGDISPQGRLLSVTEAALNAMRDPYATLFHASVALRAVPGEFDPGWTGRISAAATALGPTDAVMDTPDIQARLEALATVLTQAERRADALGKAGGSATLTEAASLAVFLLGRVRAGWNESGLWSPQATAQVNAAEVEAIEDELYHRLRGVQRAAMLRAGRLEAGEARQLGEFCESLAMG